MLFHFIGTINFSLSDLRLSPLTYNHVISSIFKKWKTPLLTPCYLPAMIPFPCSTLIIPQFHASFSDLTFSNHVKVRLIPYTRPLSTLQMNCPWRPLCCMKSRFSCPSLSLAVALKQSATLPLRIFSLGFQADRLWYLSLLQRLLAHSRSSLLIFPITSTSSLWNIY